MERVPHSDYNGVLGFFIINALKYRRKTQNVVFLYKLVVGNID